MNSKSNLNSNLTLTMSAFDEIKTLLKQDILNKTSKKIKPLRNNKFTKSFINYNKKLLKEGRTTKLIEPNALYNLDTGNIIRSHIDKRSGKIKNSFLKKHDVIDSVFSKKNNTTKDFRYISTDTSTESTWNEENNIKNNNLLNVLIKNNNISGNNRIIITKNQTKLIDGNYEINSEFWKNYNTEFQVDSEFMRWNFQLQQGDIVHIIFTKEKKLPTKFYEQKFLDGVNHCFFHPISEWCLEKIEESKSKGVKKHYNALYNKINKEDGYLNKYKSGIPENKIPDVCEDLQIGVDIDQPFSKNLLVEVRPMKKARKVFKYTNLRANHIEHNVKPMMNDFAICDKEAKIVSREEMENLVKEQCIYTKKTSGIRSLKTIDNCYKLDDSFYDTVKEFQKANNLDCYIDAIKYPLLQEFINMGTHFNMTVDFKDVSNFKESIPENVKHIDMTKAYTQFKNYKNYSGFMGKITDFRKTNSYTQNGLYYIDNLDFTNSNPKFIKLNEILKWYQNNNIYTKQELDTLKSHKVNFNVKYGAYGLNLDFDFNDDMINKKEEVSEGVKIPYYAMWTGQICSLRYNKNLFMRGTDEYFQTIKNDVEIYKTDIDNEYRISYPKKYLNNKKHIASQIIAYQRLIMLDQLLEMDLEKVYRICVDGIYYDDHAFNINKCFSYKDKKTFQNSECGEYLSNIQNKQTIDIFKDIAEPREFYKKECFKGAGGNGKTYYNLFIDRGLINKVYIAQSWKLASAMKKKYEKEFNERLPIQVHHNLLCRPHTIEIVKKYNNYIIDECSMINEEQKDYIFNNVLGKVIFCGDLGFQLPPIQGIQMNLNGFYNVTELTKNYRFTCDKLIKIIKFVRDNINNKIDYKSLGFQMVNKDFVKNNYSVDDMILVYKHIYNNEYCEMFKDIPKYKVLDNKIKGFHNGDIVKENVKGLTTEFRHGFTVHSVQGEDYDKNIFIDMRTMNDNQLFYTAISRAKTFNQIHLIF